MNLPEFRAGGGTSPASSSKKELQLQGPRPPPLKVSKESRKIEKPPRPPPPAAAHHHHRPAAPEASRQQQLEPVIIYSVSPKVHHVTASDFMDVVQRLTGPSAGEEAAAAGGGDVSPAARLASIEKTSPSEKERAVQSGGHEEMMWMLEEGGVEVGQFPGVLSPGPATLPPIPPEYFSPVVDSQTASFLSEIWSTNSFLASPSPSGLLSAAVLSPQPSPDLFNIFND